MMNEEPPFIGVGADVSAKFKGAFCEARVKAAKKLVKCKVLLKNGTSCIVNDDQIEGTLKLNGIVKVKQDNENLDGTIIKLTDNSLYTVVFDDGDEKTLRRTSLCLKGERHFQEDETLDSRPLNNPENFSTPVPRIQKEEKTRKRTRLSSQNSDCEEEEEEVKQSPKKKRESLFGKVVCVELGERRKSWFPALCLHKQTSDDTLIEKGQILVQSFKDGRKLGINKTDMKEFSKDKEPLLSYMRGDTKIDPILRGSIEKALAFYDNGELPRGWNIDLNEVMETSSSDEEEEEMPKEMNVTKEEEEFLTKLYKLMIDQGTPISKPPLLGCKEIDLYRLYEIVMKHGGMDEVSNLAKWRSIYIEMGMTNPPTTASYNMRNFYKRYLYPYEALEKGIDLNVEKKCNEKEIIKEKEKTMKQESDSENENNAKRRLTRMQSKNESDSEIERRETRSRKPRRQSVERLPNDSKGGKQIGSPFESSDESIGSSAEMGTYSKKGDIEGDSDATKQSEAEELVDIVNSPNSSVVSEDKEFSDTRSESEVTMTEDGRYPIGARILVKYGKGKLHRAYEAKIIDIDSELTPDLLYFVHYRGWNHRYDEWIKHDFIEGLSPFPPKKKGASTKGTKGKESIGGYKSHPEPPGVHNYHSTISVPRTTARSRKAGSPPHSHTPNPPTHTPDKQTKPTQINQKTSNIAAKQSSSTKAQTATTLTTTTKNSSSSSTTTAAVHKSSSKSATTTPAAAATTKTSFAVQKIDSPYSDMKAANPVKARTTRNSMQDVFLITALEESISESPGNNDVSGRSRKLREKPIQSPSRHEAEESESSSAKEDDVDSLERGSRSTPLRKAARRKRNEKSPYSKQDSKDSAGDEESISEYTWNDDKKEDGNGTGDNRGKLMAENKRKRGNRGRVGRPKNPAESSNEMRSENFERQTSAMEILTDCALKEEADLAIKSENDDTTDTHKNEEEKICNIGEDLSRINKRKSDGKGVTRLVKNESGKNLSKDFKEDINEKLEKENIEVAGTNDVEIKKMKTENNNEEESTISNENDLACMEHVVNILQQAAAIDAEKQRKSKEVTSPQPHGRQDVIGGTKTPDKERRKKKRERKRHRRPASCSVADASESENSMQSPFRKGRNLTTVEFDKEKYDFVSDLNKLGDLEAAERIRIIQGRIYEVQRLYGKLKTELASIERRRRRKLRRQGEHAIRNSDVIMGK